MKRTSVLGIAVLLAPLAACATLNPFASLSSPATPPAHAPAPAPDAKQITGQPADLESTIREAQAARKSGDLTAATKMLSQLVLFAPDDAGVLGEYGKTLAAEGRSDDALAFLERATQLKPDDWSLISALGVAFDQKGNYPAAQAAYTRALTLKPGEPSVLNNDALSHMQSGDLDGAETLLRQAVPGTPEFPRIAQNLALVQSLKAAQPAKQAAAAAPPAPVPAPVVAVAAPPAPVVAPTPAPLPVEAPVPQQLAAPLPPPAPVVAAALEPPPEPAAKKEPSAIEILKADPTVYMQPVPKDEQPDPMPRALPAKVVVATPKTAGNAAPPPKLAVTNARSAFYVQAGSYNTEGRAGEAASALDRLGARVMSGVVGGRAVYRVRIGPFLNAAQASAAMEQAHALGRNDLSLVTE